MYLSLRKMKVEKSENWSTENLSVTEELQAQT